MNKILIRILCVLLIASPFIYISTILKDVIIFFIGVLILGLTVSIKKKRKLEDTQSVEKDSNID